MTQLIETWREHNLLFMPGLSHMKKLLTEYIETLGCSGW